MNKHVITEDGSSTLYSTQFDEHYHSTHGAIQESMHVFIDAALKHKLDQPEINILEMGFGTGLNALLTLMENNNSVIHYVTLEAFPINIEMVSVLNYPHSKKLVQLHDVPWDQWMLIDDHFHLYKAQTILNEFQPDRPFDIIYFDAFSPDTQSELWTDAVFQKMYSWCKGDAVFTTYCAKGAVRRSLEKAGFTVELCEGPPGKRHMIRAKKI